jgi:hypothetical protein
MPRSKRAATEESPQRGSPSWRVPLEVVVTPDARRLVWRYRATRPSAWDSPALDKLWREKLPGVARTRQLPASASVRRSASASRVLLAEFLELAPREVPAESIAAYARRFGVFHHHGRGDLEDGEGYDDCQRWRAQAQLYSAALTAAADIREGVGRPGLGHWVLLAKALGRPLPSTGPAAALTLLDFVSKEVTPHVRLFVGSGRFEAGAPRKPLLVTVGGADLLGALCSELLAELQGGAPRLVLCDGCGRRPVPRRQSGRRAFCSACQQRGVPVQAAKRDATARRERFRQALESGATIAAAARSAYGREPTKRELATARKWAGAKRSAH